MSLSESEQSLLDEMIRTRNPKVQRPPWMQSQRYTRVQKEARRRIAELPPRSPEDTRRGAGSYHAARRVQYQTRPGHWSLIHESDGDLPICPLGRHWADAPETLRRELGPGEVTCGHCALTAGRC